MKQLLLGLMLAALSLSAQAQQDLLGLARADISSARTGMVVAAMDLTPSQQQIFWPIYSEYAEEQDALLVRRMEMLKEFADSFDKMTTQHANHIAQLSFTIQRARLQRREDYFDRMSKALDPILAARFIQVDSQVSTLLDFELMKATPLIAPPPGTDVELVE